MSRFNLNRPVDFAALTLGTGVELLQAFGRDRSEWDIVEGSYKGGGRGGRDVLFHIFQSVSDYQASLPSIQDSGGRRKIKLVFPYEDGQTTDDLGRAAASFDLEVVFFGERYKAGMNGLMEQLNRPEPGTLIHPVLGSVRCAMETFTQTHSHDMKQAVTLRLHMIEHNFSVAKANVSKKTVKSSLSGAVKALQAVARAIETVRAAVLLAVNLRRTIEAKIAAFQAFVQGFLVDANATFNTGSSTDLPGILPVNQGGLAAPTTTRNTSSTTLTANIGGTSITPSGYIRVGTRFTTVIAPTDPFANLPAELLSAVAREAVAVLQLTQRVDIARQQANEIVGDIESAQGGDGATMLYDVVQTIIQMAVSCQEVLQSGITSSRSRIVTYTVPRLMSVREVAFANGLTPNDGEQIEIMNPTLESANYIPRGTVLKIPVSR